MEIIVGERIVNKAGDSGVIAAFDGQYITVDYQHRTAGFLVNAFEEGHIRYENPDLQNKILEEIAQEKIEAAQKAEEARIAAERAKEEEKPRPH